MDPRPGIGATSAAAVIFSVILVSNLAIYISSQGRFLLYSRAEEEASFSDTAVALSAAAGANALVQVQAYLDSRTLNCSDAVGAVSAYVTGLSARESEAGVSASARASMTAGMKVDNLTMLRPFNGSVPGQLDIALEVTSSGVSESQGVWMSKDETHSLHLPVRIPDPAADCAAAVDVASDAAASTFLQNCTSTAIEGWLASATESYAASAREEGFSFSVQVIRSLTSPCSAIFLVELADVDIPGVGGQFTVRLEEQGHASFEQSTPSRQA